MAEILGTQFDCVGNVARKKRTRTCRRPCPDSKPFTESRDHSLSTPSDDVGKVLCDENEGCNTISKRKYLNLNQCATGISSTSGAEGEKPYKKIKKQDEGTNVFNHSEPGHRRLNNKRSIEGVLAPANQKSSSKVNEGFKSQSRNGDMYGGSNGESLSLDGLEKENKVKKVKLKVGGVMSTILANSSHNDGSGDGSSMTISHSSDTSKFQPQNLQGNSDDGHCPVSDKRSGLQGIPWKDFSKSGFGFGKKDSSMGKKCGKNSSGRQGDKSESVRKSRQAPRLMVGEFDDDEDDEIRYLEKLKTSKVSAGCKEDYEETNKKQKKLSAISNIKNAGASKSGEDGKKSRPNRVSEETDYEGEDELASDCKLEDGKKKPRKESVEALMDNKREMTLTTRQRARQQVLQSSEDASPGVNLIEFPNGLPPAPPRKQKEKLSEVEQQLKKAEAAQRRKVQAEKADKEAVAEATKRILTQDSGRKKKEDKIKKRREEMAQEKAANSLMLPSSTIRWTIGPNGTVVTFPKEMGLPSIFDSKSCSYPPPRETCAGPSCTNPYKYRDSKSKLPLCSLQCYKAIQEQRSSGASC